MISGFHCSVNEAFALLGYTTPLIGSYRRFGTAFQSHLQGSSNLLGLLDL